MKRVGKEFYYLQAARFGIQSDVTNQDRPRGICLERRNIIIEIRQIGPRVKKKKKKKKKKREREREDIFMIDNARTKGQLMGKDKYSSSLSGRLQYVQLVLE